MTPQFLAWWVIYGNFILIPQGSGFIDFSNLALFSVLFNLHHGLFSWHPLLLIGLVGIYFLWKKQRILALSLLGVFILQWILNAAVEDWWASWSFGHRRFINLLPIFALGLALIFSKIKYLTVHIIAFLLVFSLAIWNQLFIYQYMKGLIPRGNAITYQHMFSDKFHLARLLELKKHVFSAYYYFKRKDIKRMKTHAKFAYENNPSHLNAHIIYGLACILSGDSKQGFKVFQSWHNLDSKDILAKYGLAEYLIRQGKTEIASNLFSASNCSKNDLVLCQTINSKIQKKQATLLDKNFGNLYSKKLAELYKN